MVIKQDTEPEKTPASQSPEANKAAPTPKTQKSIPKSVPKNVPKRSKWRRLLLFVFLLVAVLAALAAWVGYPTLRSTFDTWTALFERDHQAVTTISGKLEQLQKRLDTLERNLSETRKLTTANAEEMRAIDKESMQRHDRSSMLDARLERLKTRIDRLGRRTEVLAGLKHHVSNLEVQISSLHEQVTFSTRSPAGQLFLLNEVLHYLDDIPQGGDEQGVANRSLHTAISLLDKLAPSLASSSAKSLAAEINILQNKQDRDIAGALQQLDAVLKNGLSQNARGQNNGDVPAGEEQKNFWQEIQQTLAETVGTLVSVKRLSGNQQQLNGVTVNSLLLARSALLSEDLALWQHGLDNALLSLKSAGMEQTEAYASLTHIRNISLVADLASVDRIYTLVQILRNNLQNGRSI